MVVWKKGSSQLDEFEYYATFKDDGKIRTVFRMHDPEFMFAL